MLARSATLVMLMMLVGSGSADFDWCKHNCGGRFRGEPSLKHCMCEYQEGGGPECSDYRQGLNEEEKQAIVNLHNKLRAKVARGEEARGPQPSASNMMELVWDEEVAMIAQRWADQCHYGGHDACRKTMDGVDGGQNVGALSGYGMDPQRVGMITDLITAWYNEVKDMDPRDVDSVFRNSRGEIGHYTQLVWARSSRIGCGLMHLRGGSFAMKLVCNYKARGNIVSRPVYQRGGPASNCPKNSEKSKRYDGLCISNGNEVYDEPSTQVASFPSFNSATQDYDDFSANVQPSSGHSGFQTFHNLEEIRNFMQSAFPQLQQSTATTPHQPPWYSSPQPFTLSFPSSNTPDVITEIHMSPRSDEF